MTPYTVLAGIESALAGRSVFHARFNHADLKVNLWTNKCSAEYHLECKGLRNLSGDTINGWFIVGRNGTMLRGNYERIEYGSNFSSYAAAPLEGLWSYIGYLRVAKLLSDKLMDTTPAAAAHPALRINTLLRGRTDINALLRGASYSLTRSPEMSGFLLTCEDSLGLEGRNWSGSFRLNPHGRMENGGYNHSAISGAGNRAGASAEEGCFALLGEMEIAAVIRKIRDL